jgi:hypothetical protein
MKAPAENRSFAVSSLRIAQDRIGRRRKLAARAAVAGVHNIAMQRLPAYRIRSGPSWASDLTPRDTMEQPIHRWFVFPHSFGPGLVERLAARWSLAPGSTILDPFCGSGTTLLSAQQSGLSGLGLDLSPLAILASQTKVSAYSTSIRHDWDRLRALLDKTPLRSDDPPASLLTLFPPLALRRLLHIKTCIHRLTNASHRRFFLLALVAILPAFTRMRRSGGWPRFARPRQNARRVFGSFDQQVETMLTDVATDPGVSRPECIVLQRDARTPWRRSRKCDCLITSPPYPNRHDYSRIFGVELLFAFLNEAGVRDFRQSAIRSNVEARAPSIPILGYSPPPELHRLLERVRKRITDQRVPLMLAGYFQDMYLSLRAASAVLRPEAPMALIVGNVRYGGVMIPVDRLLATIASSLGMHVDCLLIARHRGNSAQQMGAFGRHPSRESILLLFNSSNPIPLDT